MTRSRSQAGLSLVELIIGMAVTSLVLSGMVAVVFTLTNSYNTWVGRIGNASNGDVLAAAIQADSHRLIACPRSSTELDFCLVDNTRVVAYCSQGPAPYTVIRGPDCDPRSRGRQVMVRGLAASPTYVLDCDGAAGVNSGYVEAVGVSGLGPLRVYFRGPLGPCNGS